MRRSPSLLVYNRALWTYSTGSGVTFSWADVQKVQRDGMKKMILLEKIHVIWVKPPVHISQNIFKHQVNYVSPHSVASIGNIRWVQVVFISD
jgi:hypothetical protein